MITKAELENFGPFEQLEWIPGQVNLILAENGRGKTFLLKALYTAVKSLEAHGKGQEPRDFSEILADKLFWTFQTEQGIGDLVRKGAQRRLKFALHIDEKFLTYSFTGSASKEPGKVDGNYVRRNETSVFLPAKEVISLHSVIAQSRRVQNTFGFDDTYLDLITYLETEPERGRNYDVFAKIRNRLDTMLDGRVIREGNEWYYKQGNAKIGIHQTAEGVKKIAILHRLLGNKTLSPGSIICIDEPEAALHPTFILAFMEMIFDLARTGIQVFLASHSYFVLKKFFLLSAESRAPETTILSLESGKPSQVYRPGDGLPHSSIVEASIELYERELDLAL